MNKPLNDNDSASRRQFLKSSAVVMGAVAAPYLLSQREAFAVNSDTLKVGLIGCGGRGSGAASQALAADKNVILTAMGDAFEDRLQSSLKNLQESVGKQVQVTPDHCFVGLDAFHKVIKEVDVVILTTPPGFRPAHLKAAIAAGKHVFCEKPMAVDAPGLRSVLESAAEAKRKGLALGSGFCWRSNLGERAIMQRIHDGQIGEVRALYNTYNTGPVGGVPVRKPEMTDMQYQLRNWYHFAWLSGDHIVEQAVHSLDKMAWVMKDVPPVRCMAHGGRQARTGDGHIFDHFEVVYDYATGERGFHFSRQQANTASENADYYVGTKGYGKIKAFGALELEGENPWKFKGDRPDMYQVEHNELFASIRSGKPINHGTWMASSTMLAIMGRMAAYTGQIITWDQAMNSQEVLGPTNLDLNTPLSTPKVAIPGVTKFV